MSAAKLGEITNVTEAQAMRANDVRALASQLNEAIQRAAALGLRVELTSSSTFYVHCHSAYCPSVRVKILAEVE